MKICRARLRSALKGNLKTAKTLELGCTPDELLEHLERTMSPGTTFCVFVSTFPPHTLIPTNLSKRDKLPLASISLVVRDRAASIKISPL